MGLSSTCKDRWHRKNIGDRHLLGRAGDTDARGCADNGRATRVYNISKARAYRSLRGGKKAAVRRHLDRAARREGKLDCSLDAFGAANCP